MRKGDMSNFSFSHVIHGRAVIITRSTFSMNEMEVVPTHSQYPIEQFLEIDTNMLQPL